MKRRANAQTNENNKMKTINVIVGAFALAASLASTLAVDKAAKNDSNSNTYPMTICIVSGEKLGGDMGDPYVFKQDGREVRLCCKSCLKDFKKDPAKYLKKLDEAKK